MSSVKLSVITYADFGKDISIFHHVVHWFARLKAAFNSFAEGK